MSHTLIASIDAAIEAHKMLQHPFYQTWNDGGLTREALKGYACQYNHFVREFPRMLSAVHSNTPDLQLRQVLLENLVDEEQGPDNHPSLWRRFARSVGASDRDLDTTSPLPATQALVDTMMALCRRGSFQEGLAALYAYESQIPEVSDVKIDGLARHYGVKDSEAIRFFTVHREADVEHSRAEREMIEKSTAPQAAPAVENAAATTARALWGFLDGVHAAYVAAR